MVLFGEAPRFCVQGIWDEAVSAFSLRLRRGWVAAMRGSVTERRPSEERTCFVVLAEDKFKLRHPRGR
ncbi:MAG: hypothetical protein KIH01_06735 [Candidatus Freyarchaeota archaeon]|nr:hypothetical protein [Candidatus Jordarchaeia archaeon]